MITNSGQMKHTCHSKGRPNNHINTQCSPLWRQRRRVFPHINGNEGAEWHPAIDCPKHLSSVDAINRLWRKSKFPLHMSHTCSIVRNLGFLLARAVVVHHEEHIASQQPYVDVRCPAAKAHHLPQRNYSITGLTSRAM